MRLSMSSFGMISKSAVGSSVFRPRVTFIHNVKKSHLSGIGVSSCGHGHFGRRSYMEDRHFIALGGKLSGVFDGHGGSEVADILNELWPPCFALNLASSNNDSLSCEDIDLAFRKSFSKYSQIVHDNPIFQKMGGSTAAVSYLHIHPTDTTRSAIITAHLGDSRIVLSQNERAIELTEDHKPSLTREKERIEALGGAVVYYGGTWRVDGRLAVTRAIGDVFLSPYVSNEPEVKSHPLHKSDEFIIAATDGLWGVFTSQEAVTFVHDTLHKLDLEVESPYHRKRFLPMIGGVTDEASVTRPMVRNLAARLLVEEAVERRCATDNTTAVITWIDQKPLDQRVWV